MEARRGGGDAALLRLSGVHKHYRNGLSSVHALCDVNLQVGPGEMVVVCGPSGHGKTTLLNLIGMLEPACAGSIVLDGIAVNDLAERARIALRERTIGAVFQCFKLIPVMTAQENVMLPLLLQRRLKRPTYDDARALAAELLARLGLAAQVHQYPARLDAGQRQRVAIARALMTRPRLVLADEPSARLDASSLRMMLELFSAAQKEQGTAFVISTRDQRQLGVSARTLQLNEGRLGTRPADLPRLPWVAAPRRQA